MPLPYTKKSKLLSVVTLNTKGLLNPNKRYKIFNILRHSNVDIIFLQETHNLTKDIPFVKSQWLGDSVWNHHTAILSNNKSITFFDSFHSHSDRILTSHFLFKGLKFRLLNIYAPASIQDRHKFWNNVQLPLDPDFITICGGDFNCNLNPSRDRVSSSALRTDPSIPALSSRLVDFVDTYSDSNSSPLFTFQMNTSSGHILTRLDYILVDTLHSSFDYQTDTFFACSDHLALRTIIYNRLTPTNNFFWRLNTSNLTIPHVRKHLFSLVNSLDLSPSLDAWESFKHQIRSYFEEQPVKRQNYWKKTDALNKEIIKLQKTLLLFPEADDLKKVISDKTSLRDSIAETLSEKWRIRSRSKWIEKGEKSSKYFYQRFKINSSDSFTEHLSKRHRYDQQSALDEAKDFYQNLYTPEPTDSSATQELLSSLPQLSKECSEKLLEPISYKDILKLLNQLPTFKAPGTDGLGYEFYKEFSAPLSRILANLFNNIISSGNLPLSWMLFLDQQKAFDRVNHEYMINSLKAFGFSSSFYNIIQELYSDQLASVSDGRNISTLFKLGRGVRQGDPLSPLLYILTLEPFLNLVDRRIHGIKLSKISFKTKAYADDTTIGLSHNDWHPLNQAISLYQKASNAKINFNKSVLLPLNQAAKNSHFNSPISFKKAKDDEIIRSLGFSIRNGHFDYKDTWNYILKKMEKTVAKLEQRSLSIRGRVLVAKSLILSQMWYYIPIVPPNRKTKLTIYRLIQRFIRNSNLLPAYQSLCGHITWEGVAAPDINNSINATLAKYCLGCFTSRAPWAVQLRDTIELNIQKKQKKDLHQFLERNIKSISGWPGAWKPWIRAWRLMEGSFRGLLSISSPTERRPVLGWESQF